MNKAAPEGANGEAPAAGGKKVKVISGEELKKDPAKMKQL